MDQILFTKLEGIGNDFIVIDNLDSRTLLSEQEIARLCDRHYGIGADGLILAESSHVADFKMTFHNADGSPASMCGNGIRCLAKFLRDRGMTTANTIRVETGAGIRLVTVKADRGKFAATVDMGRPSFSCRVIPVISEEAQMVDFSLEIRAGEQARVTCVSMGNPHAVIFFPRLDDAPVKSWGAALQESSIFPEKTNVEFARVVDDKNLELRVYERGVGETMACGTGACAAAVASARLGYTSREVDVRLPGGVLRVEWSSSDVVYLSGPATTIFEGKTAV